MKSVLKFNLPEDQRLFEYASNGDKAFYALHHIRENIIQQRDNNSNKNEDLIYEKVLLIINSELESFDIQHLVD